LVGLLLRGHLLEFFFQLCLGTLQIMPVLRF
jgi:hypothetical protein